MVWYLPRRCFLSAARRTARSQTEVADSKRTKATRSLETILSDRRPPLDGEGGKVERGSAIKRQRFGPIARMSASSKGTPPENKSLTPSDTLPTARRSPAMIKMGGRAAQLFLVLYERRTGPRVRLCLHHFVRVPVLNPLECRLRADECQRLAERLENPRVQAILRDMAQTWTKLALEAEENLKQSRPPLQLIEPNPPRAHV